MKRFTPPAAPTAPAISSGRTLTLLTEQPRRIDIDRVPSRGRAKFFRVKVDGQVIIPKTKAPFAIFGALVVMGWTGQVELWRDRKLIGTRDIEAEARRIIAAHNRFTLRKRQDP